VSERNENRPGYKKTKVGWIPEEWGYDLISTIGTVVTGTTPSTNHPEFYGGQYPFVTPVDIGVSPWIRCSVSTLTEAGFCKARRLKKGAVLFVCIGSTIGKVGITDVDLATNQQVNAVIPRRNNSGAYLYYALLAQSRSIASFAGCQAVPIINKNQFEVVRLPLPPLLEQKKIAEILSTWDEAIDQMRRLIDVKKRRKKALMQQLLTGEIRLSRFGKSKKKHLRFPGDWQRLRARELFEVRSVKKQNHEPVLSVTQDLGVVPRDTVERKIAFSEANTQACKLVEPGDFVISLRSFQGGIEASSYRGIVSPAYHVIRPTRKVDNTFYRYYFKCHDFIGHLVVAVIGIRDGKQVSYDDFAFMHLPYPSTEEQRAIGRILAAIDEDLKVCRRKLIALEKQKRGLMQKLLTGEVRVKVDDPKKKKPRTTRNTRTK